MLLTEEEAQQKRCQEGYRGAELGNGFMETRTISSSGASGASYGYATAPTYCIGSACMAWRWANEPRGSDGAQFVGYCGKAGRP